MTYKTENDIWTDLIALLNEALTNKNITNMTVMRSFQPIDVTGKNVVLIQRVSGKRYGWRGRKDKIVKGVMKHIENYFKEMRFQISVLKKINLQDVTELTATDIADILVDYLLSNKGLKTMRSKGYMPLRVVDVREPTFSNESDNYQINPNFDLILSVQQEIVDSQNVIDGYDFTLEGV